MRRTFFVVTVKKWSKSVYIYGSYRKINTMLSLFWTTRYIVDRPTDRRPTTDQRPTSHLGKFQMAISPRGVVRSTSCLVLRGVFEVGGSNGANSGVTKFNRYVGEINAR